MKSEKGKYRPLDNEASFSEELITWLEKTGNGSEDLVVDQKGFIYLSIKGRTLVLLPEGINRIEQND